MCCEMVTLGRRAEAAITERLALGFLMRTRCTQPHAIDMRVGVPVLKNQPAGAAGYSRVRG
jgi:hypothetical protein